MDENSIVQETSPRSEAVVQNPLSTDGNTIVTKKKSKAPGICLIVTIIFILGLIAFGVFLFGKVKAFTQPVELGNLADSATLEEFMIRTGIDFQVEYADLCFTCEPLEYYGEKDLEIVLSAKEASSLIGVINQSTYNLEEFQVSIDDELIEITTFVQYNGNRLPIYASGFIDLVDSKNVDINLYNVKVGPISIPQNYISEGSNWLNALTNGKIRSMEGLSFEELQFRDGDVYFKGTVPEIIR